MARKRYSDEDILKLLREIEVHLYDGMDVISACRKAGISDKTYYGWRKKFGGMGRSQLSEMKSLQKENDRPKKIVAELELGGCQTNEPKHQYLVAGYFYELTKERHSVRAASRLSLNVLHFESDLCELNRL